MTTTYTPSSLRSLTGDELLRQYRMQEGAIPRGHLRRRLAHAELEAHDAAMAMLRKEIDRRMKAVGVYVIDDGQGNAFMRGEHGLIVRFIYRAGRLDPLPELPAVAATGAAS